jgi:two-component system, cell cycle sensor histidine kinase and response regulator CckA
MNTRFQKLLDALPIGAVEVTRTHRICYANREFQRFVGYDPVELDGKSLLDITNSYDREALEEHLERLYSRETGYFEMETRYLRKDGTRVWGNPVRMIFPSPIRDGNATVLILVVDITRRKQLEEQLRLADKMEVLGRLAASVAHDFNNILTVIEAFAEMADQHLDDREELSASLEQIHSAAKQGAILTNKLLDFGGGGSTEVAEFSVNAMLEELAEMFDRLLPPSIDLKLDLSDQQPRVEMQEGHLHQIVSNLVLNAADAIEDAGKIRIETLSFPNGEALPQALQKVGKPFSLIRICDDGKGMRPELMERIFDPYFTTKGEEGSGLGLTSVYGIVRDDKGFIAVESVEGEGTCFEIYLPAP